MMVDTIPAPLLEGIADTLWQERHMVELLLYRMTTAKLLLAADEHRFVAAALDEVEAVLHALRDAEDRRTEAVEAVSREAHIAAERLTLAELARRAPEPLRTVFVDHLDAFRSLTAEIEETADTNRRLASGALGRVRQSLDALAGASPASLYDRDGRSEPVAARPTHLDRVL